MPFYSYNCSDCKKTFKSFHGSEEKEEKCIICKSQNITKQIPIVRNISLKEAETSAKQRVEKFIEESKEILKQNKEEAKKELK